MKWVKKLFGRKPSQESQMSKRQAQFVRRQVERHERMVAALEAQAQAMK